MNNNLNRRETLKALSIMTGMAFTSGASLAFLSGCKADNTSEWKPTSINDEDMSLLIAATERLLPKTNTPGANDALVHRYIDEVYTNIFTTEEKDNFKLGLSRIDNLSREKYKQSFVQLTNEGRDDILSILATEWKEDDSKYSIFKQLRDLTITGFATSEVGSKEFFKYNPVPGPYQGCVDYSEIGAIWA